MDDRTLPLSDLLVLDLTRARSGPSATRMLADWGADVLKIQEPAVDGKPPEEMGGGWSSSDFQNLNRNKRAMSLNLKEPEGRKLFMQLVERADMVVENYRPDVKYRLGIDYEACRAVNGRIIYGSISGFGQTGPYADRAGLDQIAQGMGGLMSVTGLPGQGPVRAGIAIADLAAGAFLVQGLLAALHQRHRTGEGQWVHTSLLEAQISMMDFQAVRWLTDHEVPPQAGNDHPTMMPTGVFPTADGHINIQATSNTLFRKLCEALDAPEVLANPAYADVASRSRNRRALVEELGAHTRKATTAHWLERLNEAGIPCGPIYTVDQTFADPQVQHLQMVLEAHQPGLGDLHLLAPPFTLSAAGRPTTARMPPPRHGQHTDEVLRWLGYNDDAIADLRRRRIV